MFVIVEINNSNYVFRWLLIRLLFHGMPTFGPPKRNEVSPIEPFRRCKVFQTVIKGKFQARLRSVDMDHYAIPASTLISLL